MNLENFFEKNKKEVNKENLDPTTFSPLSSQIKLNEENKIKRGESVIDENTGTEYFLISGKQDDRPEYYSVNPSLEQFVTLLSKGILRVSDIVEKDDKYYSKKMPLEDMESGKKMELEAENFLLRYLFSDYDHVKVPDTQLKENNEKNKSIGNTDYHQNFIKDKKGRFTHYDYEGALGNLTDGDKFAFNINDDGSSWGLKQKTTIEEIKHGAFPYNESLMAELKRFILGRTSKQLFKILRDKINLFENQIGDRYFFDAVVKKSKLNINLGQFYFLNGETPTEKQESLRKHFIERLEILKEVIK